MRTVMTAIVMVIVMTVVMTVMVTVVMIVSIMPVVFVFCLGRNGRDNREGGCDGGKENCKFHTIADS